MLEKNVCHSRKNKLVLSLNYLNRAVQSHGEYDLHFSAFVVHKLNFAPLLHYFAYCSKALDISIKYA